MPRADPLFNLEITGARRSHRIIEEVQRPLHVLHLQRSDHSVQMGLVRTESQSAVPFAKSNLGEIPHFFSLQQLFPISSSSSPQGPDVSTYVLNCQATSPSFARVQFADPPALTGAISDFIPSALKYPSFTRHFCRRTLSSNSAKARVIVSCSGRAFSRSSACAVPGASFPTSTIFSHSPAGLMPPTDDGFPIFLYGQKAHPMLFFSSAFTNCAIHSSVFSPDSPIQIGTS